MSHPAPERAKTRYTAPPQETATLSIVLTADVLLDRVARLLKPFELTAPQYNVLRILRGAAPAGASCTEIAERMINRDPDITRLLDRLAARGFLGRERSEQDRRIVRVKITGEGLRLLAELDPLIGAFHRQQFANLSSSQLEELMDILRHVRETPNTRK